MLQTSILARLSGPLCDAVTGQESGKGTEAMLVEQVFFNRPMGDKVFSQPHAPMHMNSAKPHAS